MQTLPSGIKKVEATDNAAIVNFNVNADLLDEKVTELDAATPNLAADTLVKRDTGGRFKAAAPVAVDDVARKDTVDSHAANTSHVPYAAATGSANTYAVTLSPVPTAYVDGLALAMKVNVNNTGASTVNVNGLGAIPVRKSNGNAVSAGNLRAGSIYTFRYSAGNFILQGEGGEYGTATAPDVLSGKTIGTEDGIVAGSMPNRAGDTPALSSATSGTTLKLLASQGYRDGVDDYVTITDPNFIASNIRKDINLLGTIGTLIEGKQFANGSQAAGSTTLNISGLSFAPKIIIVASDDNIQDYFNTIGVYLEASFFTNAYARNALYELNERTSGAFNVTSNGFSVSDLSSTRSFVWFAFGW